MSEFKSWDELTVLEQLQSTWWDAYKDAYNVRPRGVDTDNWTEDDFRQAISRLSDVIGEQEDQRKVDETAAAERFEKLVAKTMAAGAANRKQALQWIMDASICNGDWEFLCFEHGLEYGYFRKEC